MVRLHRLLVKRNIFDGLNGMLRSDMRSRCLRVLRLRGRLLRSGGLLMSGLRCLGLRCWSLPRGRRLDVGRLGRWGCRGWSIVVCSTVVFGRGLGVSTRQVKTGLASCVAVVGAGIGGAGVVVALRGSALGIGESFWSFDNSGHQTTLDMPFNVAMEKPDS